ncbi:MAG: tetratricopeptide repeat protein [Azonexus sp.]
MNRFLALLTFALILVTISLAANAGNVDDDLRQAAKLHKGGDTAQAMAIWKTWAEKGNVDAAYNLAVIHQYGDGVVLDYTTAMRWYKVAAEQGDKVSQFQIGLMYQTGQGVEANAEEAHRWFTAHRKHHMHHAHTPQMEAWREQARAMIDERDRREAAVAARRDGAQVVADLRRRAGIGEAQRIETANIEPTSILR